ncbi:MAG: MaoC family dehydratase [Bacteroidetes bacterium]|nr:MaoC family dehydratase [Bacteroidota bacterium]
MKVGDVVSWERTFTEDDVRLFGKLSGDEGIHHITPDDRGRIMVQGLLTATLPTKIGGDMNFIARELNFQFHRPVFVGDTVKCEVTMTQFEKEENVTKVSLKWVCTNQLGKVVLTGHTSGIVKLNAELNSQH